LSITVSVTVRVPGWNGPGGLSVRLAMVPSGSNDPLSTAATVSVARQFVPTLLVTLRHSATGGEFVAVEVTATVKVQVVVFDEASRAVHVTVVVPTGNVEPDGGEHATVALEQLSEKTGVG
jgi:hypothetical protein